SDPSAPMPVTGGTNNGSDATVTTDPSASSVTVTGLTNGASYTVTVWAANSVGWGPASDPSPTVKPFDPASDTSPPVLSSLDVSPTSLDTSAAPATVTITARIVDDLAGLAPYYPSSSVSLRSPSGHQSLYWSFNESNRISGNALDGTYRAVLTLPQYSETGTWTLSANLSDALGNTASLTTKALADAGLPSSVTQSGTVADVTGPVLAGLTFSPSSLDTSGDAQVVTVTAHLTDDLSGLSSYRPSIWLRSPSGRQGASVSLAMESGTGRDGLWTGTATIPRYSDAGTWTTAGIYLSDAIGNSTSYGTADLTAAGFPTGFTQTGTADTTAPTLAGLTIAPASVDTSASPQSVVVSAHVTDNLAGLPQTGYGLSVVFRSPSGHQTIGTYSSTRLSGSAVDGVWQQTITVPRDAEHGRWTVSGVSVTDALSNSRTFSSDDLAAAGLATSFDQTGAGDSAPPAVRSLTFTPGAIDTSAGTKVVTIQARLTDDRSGVSSAWLQMMPPSGRQTSYVQLTRTSGDSRDGVYEGRLTVGRYAEAGTWRVSTLTMSDLVQNWASLTASDLRAAGLSSSFEQTGTADTVAPQLAALTWTPGTVDTAAAARTVTVRGRFTDDLSGLPAGYGPYVTLKSPSGRQMTGTSFNRVSGTGRDATYEAALTVNRYSEAGAWTVSDLSVTDNAQNTRHLTGAELTTAGFTAGFTQTGAADTAAPVLVAVSAAPARIDTSAAAANVTVTAHITDDKSGMGMYTGTVTFTSPSGAQSVKGYFGMPASGTGLDGTYQVNLGVPRYAEPGTWTLSAAELTDLVGNQVKLGAADLAAAGISASFEQIGTTGDRQAPVLADFSVNPGAVNVATSVQRVTVRAHVTDDLSGVSGYSVAATFTSPSGQATLTVPFGDSTRTSG
ncbi:MAG: hypothetical protein QOI86_5441, partial [Actinomycetota bacterium]|nr:hypothetical protein [Actinomycetota bacterium]